jgi:hypothetical protein
VGESIGVGDVGGGITAEMDEKRKRTNSSGLPRFLWNEGMGPDDGIIRIGSDETVALIEKPKLLRGLEMQLLLQV